MRIIPLTATVTLAICILGSSPARPQKTGFEKSAELDAGYHDMYNLHFDRAHAKFEKYMVAHPKDPMGPVSNAAAYLFSEFHRTGVLDMQLFTNDQNYLQHKQTPDPKVKQELDNNVVKAQQLADMILVNDPKNSRALFAKTLSYGLDADYASCIPPRQKRRKRGRKRTRRVCATCGTTWSRAFATRGCNRIRLTRKLQLRRSC